MKKLSICAAACGTCSSCRTRRNFEESAAAVAVARVALEARFGSIENAQAEDAKWPQHGGKRSTRCKGWVMGYHWIALLKRLEKRLGAAPAVPPAAPPAPPPAAPPAAPAKAAKPARARTKVAATSVKAAKTTKRASGRQNGSN